ncbi:hypothetical protein QU38_02415, partial [Staphylococcus aureus]
MIEELVDGSLPRRWIDRRRGRVVRIEIGGQPIDLIGVEHEIMAKETNAAFALGTGHPVRLGLFEARIIDRERAVLPPANMAAE